MNKLLGKSRMAHPSYNKGFLAAGSRPWSQEVEKPRSIFKRHTPFAKQVGKA